MHTSMETQVAAAKTAARMAAGIAIVLLGLILLAVLEAYSAWYAFASATQGDLWTTPWGEYPRAALLHSALSIGCGLAAFVGMMIAGWLKEDERKVVADRAFAARAVAIGFVLIPIGYLSGAFAFDRQAKAWEVYQASPAFAIDVKVAEDPMSDPIERQEARYRIEPPATAERSFMDAMKAVFLHALVMWSASAFRIPRPVTDGERRAIKDAEKKEKRNAAARARRKARAKEMAKEKRPNVFALRAK